MKNLGMVLDRFIRLEMIDIMIRQCICILDSGLIAPFKPAVIFQNATVPPPHAATAEARA